MDISKKIDPLYTIFEQHLFNFQDPNEDRKSFIEAIVKDYLVQLRKMGFAVPKEWEDQISEELCFQVNTMLVKKIYGCLTINEYTAKIPTQTKKQARTRYRKLQQAADQKQNETGSEVLSATAPRTRVRKKAA